MGIRRRPRPTEAAHHIAERPERKVVLVALDGFPADEWLIRHAAG